MKLKDTSIRRWLGFLFKHAIDELFAGSLKNFEKVHVRTAENIISVSTVPAPLTAAVSNQKLSFWALDCHIKSK